MRRGSNPERPMNPENAVSDGRGIFLRFAMLGGANIGGAGLSFVAALLVTRVAGASTFGQLSLGLTVLTYALLITTFGTDVSAVRVAAAHPETVPILFPSVTALRLGLAVPVCASIWLLAPLLADGHPAQAVLKIMAFSLFANAFFPLWLPQAFDNALVTSASNIGFHAVNLALTMIAAFLGMHVWAFAASKLIADSLIAAMLFFWALRRYPGMQWSRGSRDSLRMARQSLPIALSQVVRGFAFASDILIVGIVLPAATVGHYSAAYRIFTLMLSMGSMYFIVLFPIMSRRAQDGDAIMGSEISLSLRRMIPVTLAIAGIVIATAPIVLPFAFGSDFAVAVPSLQILTLAIVANFIQRTYARMILACGEAGLELRATILATVLAVILKIYTTLGWGITGTAFATLIGEVVLLLLQRRYALRILKMRSSI